MQAESELLSYACGSFPNAPWSSSKALDLPSRSARTHLRLPLHRVAIRHTLRRGRCSVRGSIGRSSMALDEEPGRFKKRRRYCESSGRRNTAADRSVDLRWLWMTTGRSEKQFRKNREYGLPPLRKNICTAYPVSMKNHRRSTEHSANAADFLTESVPEAIRPKKICKCIRAECEGRSRVFHGDTG